MLRFLLEYSNTHIHSHMSVLTLLVTPSLCKEKNLYSGGFRGWLGAPLPAISGNIKRMTVLT